jgi:hypothetical protein
MDNYNEILRKIEEKEREGKLVYDKIPETQKEVPLEQPKVDKSAPLGRATYVEEQETLGMESPWKILPIDNLPSAGFGYPSNLEIGIRSAKVAEIRHYSTIDEFDPIDVDDKINHILSKNVTVRYVGGTLSYMDLYQEDRFYIFMAIRDLTFIKGENKLMLPLTKNCEDKECPMPKEIELRSNILSNFKLPERLKKYYSIDQGCYVLKPKNGESPIELFIPTIGIITRIRKILRDKKKAGKKYDPAFASYSTFIIPNWRDLDEELYNQYELASKEWTYMQFNVVDQISKEITFATKNQVSINCQKCGAEVTAPLRFRGGLRSLYIIPDIFGELQ